MPSATRSPSASAADDRLLRRIGSRGVRRSAGRLTLSYVVGLSLIASLTVGAYLIVADTLDAQRADGAIVNVAGRQRMLSQKIAKSALALASSEPDDPGRAAYQAELRDAIAAFEAGDAALRRGDAAMGVPATTDPEALADLRGLEAAHRGLIDAAEALAAGEDPSGVLPRLMAEAGEFLPKQDALVHRYASLARAKVEALREDHHTLLWVTLGLLVAEALLVFEPAARAMRAQLRCLQEAGERMSHEARHDSLTGLPNRNALLTHLDEMLHPPGGRDREELAVFFLDFDRFKAINDSLGHDAGDDLLRGVADRARELESAASVGSLRAFRLGGDEFVLTLHGAGTGHEVRVLAERALASFAEPHRLRGHTCVSTASIGIATAPKPSASDTDPRLTASELLRNADLAMMQAKAAGKNRYIVFEGEMYRFAQRRRCLEEGLRLAVGAGQLGVSYLPGFSAADGRLEAVAASLHWAHPSLGEVGHAELVEVAEESGAIHQLGEWFFREVASQVEAGGSSGSLPQLRLPVSQSEAAHPGFVRRVEGLLEVCPALAGRLCLGFSEASLGRATRHFARLAERLSEIGAETCIEDAGGSQASLFDLARLAIHRIRLAPACFEADSLGDARSMLVPGAMIVFAHGMGVSVTAAGIDSPDAVAAAVDLGVDTVEGTRWGGPGELSEVLTRGPVQVNAETRRAA